MTHYTPNSSASLRHEINNSLTHIFEPFVSYKKGGTGLGLAIVQSIISAHHGHLSLETSPGRGCIFRILLPVSLSPVEKSAK